jgi:dTDP-glucose pyrophosphorylase
MIGIIPAAGRGTRAYPYTDGSPKGMVDIGGRPNLDRTIEIMRDKLRVSKIVIIVGAFGDQIREYFSDGTRVGVPIVYVENDSIERGLGYSLLLARPYVDDYACVMLSDECYVDSNHEDILSTDYRSVLATCAVRSTDTPELIEKNYAVYSEDGLVHRIVEKPQRTEGALLGLGTFVLSPQFFTHLNNAVKSGTGGHSDPVSVLGELCAKGARIASFELRGLYVNINDRDALNLARATIRSHNFDAHTLGLCLLMKGSAKNALRSVNEFVALNRFHQVVLVLPPGGSPPKTPEGVECVSAPSSRYGDMMRTGFDAVRTDILICAHSDGSCLPRDMPKFLEYLKESDVVVGTRTTRQLIEQGTNMRGTIRVAHIVLAKLLELVWWQYEPRFTDLGCTYRAIWRSSYELIRNNLRTSGPEYSVEMLLETLRCQRRVIEIPVSFALSRKGPRERDQTFGTFFSILTLIVRRRFEV